MEVLVIEVSKMLTALNVSIEAAEQMKLKEKETDYWEGYKIALIHVKELIEKFAE